tara:strand:- start:152 stop:385 length:234 start_codon:yes stop_codon:yes gene_type:complete
VSKFLATALTGIVTFIGVVDQKFDDVLVVELTDRNGTVSEEVFSVHIMPCDLQEGDMFYFFIDSGVTEIRCGEPEPQ